MKSTYKFLCFLPTTRNAITLNFNMSQCKRLLEEKKRKHFAHKKQLKAKEKEKKKKTVFRTKMNGSTIAEIERELSNTITKGKPPSLLQSNDHTRKLLSNADYRPIQLGLYHYEVRKQSIYRRPTCN